MNQLFNYLISIENQIYFYIACFYLEVGTTLSIPAPNTNKTTFGGIIGQNLERYGTLICITE